MSQDEVDSLVGEVLGDRYRLIAPMGLGRPGRTYQAEDLSESRFVEVRLLPQPAVPDGEFHQLFQEVVAVTASLNHPHIAAVHDWGTSEHGPYLVGEYLGGGTLQGMFDAGHRLSPSQALIIGLETARGLEQIHHRGLIHGGVAPSSILFDSQGRVRLADIGLSQVGVAEGLGEPAGSGGDASPYASPEQIQGWPPGHSSDVYSLVMVLVAALTGHKPIAATDSGLPSIEESLISRFGGSIDLAGEFGRFGLVLERAARPNPEERPEAGELAIGFLATTETLPRPTPLPLEGSEPGFSAPEGKLSGVADTDDDPQTTEDEAVDTGVHLDLERTEEAGADSSRRAPVPILEREATLKPLSRWRMRALDGKPPRQLLWVLVVLVLIGGLGWGGYALWDGGGSASVPNVVGFDRADLGRVERSGWVLDLRELRQDGTTPGEVLNQNPPPGTKLAEGETVTVWVSLGDEKVVIPGHLVGVTVAEAEHFLSEVGLVVGEVVENYDEVALWGTITKVNELFPELDRGASVDLEVSLGPLPRVVPAIDVGMPLVVAQERLESNRLVLVEVREEHNEIELDHVVSVDPSPGTEVGADSPVTVVVSAGPQQIEVPDVVTLSVQEATQILEEIELCAELLSEEEGGEGTEVSPDTQVLATNPPAAEFVDYGSCVKLVTQADIS